MSTMKSQQLSDWIPATAKPALPGWYDVRYRDREQPYFKRRYFDGAAWRFNPTSPTCLFGNNQKDAKHELWRGLASDPKAVMS